MILEGMDGLGWLLLVLGPLLLFQRWLHHELQAILLIVTRRPQVALVLFSVLFFPGVLLHESSHFLMARLLGVRTGRFSLLPRPLKGGRLQLGFVETDPTDFVRDALIGAAPLITGGLLIAYIGIAHMEMMPLANALQQGNLRVFLASLSTLPSQADFWLWFYLAFAVSSTMLPSAADRRAWLPITLALCLLVGAALLAGAGPWMAEYLAPALNQALRVMAAIFGLSLILHVVLLFPAWLLHTLLSRLTGLEVA